MATNNSPSFFNGSLEKPIESETEDLLGRRGFSHDLAHFVAQWQDKSSIVFALYGEWGDGKTSIKNMAKEYLQKKHPEIYISEFNPWAWSAQEKLLPEFFSHIKKTLQIVDVSEEFKTLSEQWALKHSEMEQFNSLTTGILDATVEIGEKASTLAAKVTVALFGTFLISLLLIPYQEIIVPFVLLVTSAWTFLFGTLSSFAKAKSNYYKKYYEITRKDEKELKAEIYLHLQSKNKKCLIIIDDIDRLTASEIKNVFQLVKANSDFPNLIYLLLFDRNIVEKALTDKHQDGNKYLEKIIQYSFDTPILQKSQLRRITLSHIQQLIEKYRLTDWVDSNRWYWIFDDYLLNYFSNLRDVYRFTPSLDLHFSRLCRNKIPEINPIDFICLETLRIFEPLVFQAIRNSPDILLNSLSWKYYSEKDPQAHRLKDFENEILSKSSPEQRESTRELLEELFPSIKNNMSNTYGNSTFRVCSKKYFMQYFLYDIPEGEISNFEIEEFFNNLDSNKPLKGTIQELFDKNKLYSMLLQINYLLEENTKYLSKLSSRIIELFLTLADLAENADFTTFENRWNDLSSDLLSKVLEGNQNPEEILNKILEQTPPQRVYLLTQFTAREYYRLGKIPPSNHISEDCIDWLKNELVKRYKNLAQTDQLKNLSYLDMITFRWLDWEGENGPSEYIHGLIQNTEGFFLVLKKFRFRSYESSGRGTAMSWELNLEGLEKLISKKDLLERAAEVDKENLSTENQNLLEEFIEAAAKQR